MKRSELHVGDELYHATEWQWKNHEGYKATVCSTEPYKESTWGRHYSVPKGPGVLVTMGNSDYQRVVTLGSLRGPYEQIAAEVEVRRAAAQLQEKEADQLYKERSARVTELIERATAQGITARVEDGSRSIVLSVSDFTKLIEHLDRTT